MAIQPGTVKVDRNVWTLGVVMLWSAAALGVAHAQPRDPEPSKTEQPGEAQPRGAPGEAPQAPPKDALHGPSEVLRADAGVAPELSAPDASVEELAEIALDDADAGVPEEPRGETPISPEAVVSEAVGALSDEAPAGEASRQAPARSTREPALPRVPRARRTTPARRAPKKVDAVPPLVVWAPAGWGDALGPARCQGAELVGLDPAIRIASTLRHSVAIGGVGMAPAGMLSDHPLLTYAAEREPERLAAWLAATGLTVLAVGVEDLTGPLLRDPRLSAALERHGIAVIASNLQCGAQAYCRSWASAEKPLHSVVRQGQRYVFISLLPDDILSRVEPAGGRELTTVPVEEALVQRTKEARQTHAALVVASLDHGPDSTASARVGDLLAELPPRPRPELLLSPSSGETMLFMRPLDVQPAVVGTRRGVLMGVKVTKLLGGRDTDVLARSVRLFDWDDALAAELGQLGAAYCRDRKQVLPGAQLEAPLTYEGLVPLAASAVRELADADIALIDPLVYEPAFRRAAGAELQRGEVERAVLIDAPLVTANVTLDWLAQLSKGLNDLRPLTLVNYRADAKQPMIAGRAPVVGALYSIVTTRVLARSDRLPGGVDWQPVDEPNATLRGALIAHLSQPSSADPRLRLEDPTLGTQWVLRMDGQLLGNLTATNNPGDPPHYDEPALKVNASRQLGVRFVLNYDADGPKLLFENTLNISFDRNFATKTTALDLSFVQTSYTYRGLWPQILLYPHPFVEAYAETQLSRLSEHWLLRPKLGVRSMFSHVASFKAYAGVQYELPDGQPLPGLGADFQLKPWTIVTSSGTMQLEGNITYFWSSPGSKDQHVLRAQLISSYQLVGPLQLTLTALGALRKDRGYNYGRGIGLQAGVRLRFVSRDMTD